MVTITSKPSATQMQELASLIQVEKEMLHLSVTDVRKIFEEQRGLAAINEHDEAMGFIKFIDCGESTTLKKHVFEIGSWVVAQTDRGRGVGKQLFLAMIKRIHELHDNALVVDVTRKSNTETSEILEKMGAKKISKPDRLKLYPEDMSEGMFYFFDVTHLAEH